MKIDTQGHELPILKGSVDYLYNAIGLEIEVEFAQLYRNQPLFNQVDTLVGRMISSFLTSDVISGREREV